METKNFVGKLLFITFMCLVLFSFRVAADEDISIEIVGDIVLLDDATEGIDGEPLPSDRTYLSEGEEILFTALVTIPSGIENLAFTNSSGWLRPDAYIYFKNNPEAQCLFGNVLSQTTREIECKFTTETRLSMHGLGTVDVRARTINGDEATHYIGEWFINPIVYLDLEGEINLQGSPGTSIYSNPVTITNTAEWDIPLNMFISGTDFYDSTSADASCPDFNQVSLANLKYFAENGEYSTMNDPRADAGGFVPINNSIGFNDPYPFYGLYELIQKPNLDFVEGYPSEYEENILNYNESMTLIFRLDVPESCTGNYDFGFVYVWGAAGEGWGPSTGIGIPFNFEAMSYACETNLDCNDSDPQTTDMCINPGTPDSYCQNENIIACYTNTNCKDGNPYTLDRCINPGTVQSYCQNTDTRRLAWKNLFSVTEIDG